MLLRRSELEVEFNSFVLYELDELFVDPLVVELDHFSLVELEEFSEIGELEDSELLDGVTPLTEEVDFLSLVELDDSVLRSDSELELVEYSM